MPLFFGYLYSPAYPLGTRLGVTVFWQPSVIQDFFLKTLTRRCLVISQWLILWFYTQKIYFASLDIVNITDRADAIFLSLAYLSIPRFLWRRRRRFYLKNKRKRRRRHKKRNWLRGSFSKLPRSQFRFSKFLNSSVHIISGNSRTLRNLWWPQTTLLKERVHLYNQKRFGLLRKQGQYFNKYNSKLKRMHADLLTRFLTGFYKNLVIKEYKPYFGPKRQLKKKTFITRKAWNALYRFKFSVKFDLLWYRQIWLLKFLTKRRQFFGKHLYRRFRRKSSDNRVRLSHLRFFWYIKLCFETYFHCRIALSCTSLYLAYFQPSAIGRILLRDFSSFNRYVFALKKRRTTQISKFRRQARDLSFRPGKPQTRNKFSYAQLVLFLGLPPTWRKFTNVYNLCYIVIISALLKNIQMLSQWLYNMVSLGHTRRFRLLRMRFFMQ